MPASNPRVLLIEPSRDPQLELAWALESAGFLVRIEDDIDRARHATRVFRPDAAVIGSSPSRTLVLDVVPELERDHDVPVILAREAVRAGEREGLDQHQAVVGRVAEAIEARPVRPPVLAAGDVVLDTGAHVAFRADQQLELTQTEFALLALLMRNRNRVLSKEAFIASVFLDRPVTPNAVEVHMANLRRKLEVHGPRLIKTVRGLGYVLEAERPDHHLARRKRLSEERDRLIRERNEAIDRRNQLVARKQRSPFT